MDVKVKNFVCSECGKAFDENRKMLSHFRFAHVLWKNEEFKKRKSLLVKEQNKDSVFVDLLDKGRRKFWSNPENVKDFSEKLKLTKNSSEGSERASMAAIKRWKNPEHKKNFSISIKKKWEDENYRKKMSNIFKNRPEESRKKISESNKNRCKNPEHINFLKNISNNYWNDVENRKKKSEEVKQFLLKNPEVKEKFAIRMKKRMAVGENRKAISEGSKKLWQSEEYRKKQKKRWLDDNSKNKIVKAVLKASFLSPNKCEQLLQQILNELYPNEYKFVGGGEVVIGGFCPDFINCNGKKLIIEFDGSYWHKSQKAQEKDQRKLAKYKELGFDTLVIKENEFKNDKEGVKNRIVEFVKNYEKEHYSLLV